jgi:DNA polymerase-3 subunit beta
MRFTVEKSPFVRALSRAVAVADKKSTMPILESVKLECAGGQLLVSATDLTTAIAATVEAKGEGEACVNAKALLDRVKLMADGEIAINVDDRSAIITGQGARMFAISALGGDEFPAMPDDDEVIMTEVPAEQLRQALGATSYAISDDETRMHLSSALLEFSDTGLKVAATDGHRLALAEQEIPGLAEGRMLAPKKGVIELKKLLSEGAESIELGSDGTWVHARVPGGVLFSIRLVDAQFPPYQQVIPQSNHTVVDVPSVELMSALRAVSVSSAKNTHGVRLTFASGMVKIAGESPESGEATDEVPCNYAGKSLTIGVNANYLVDAIAPVFADAVTMKLGGELDPIVIESRGYLAVVMPMRM